MATAIGDLVVNLSANNKRFNSGMGAARSVTSRFTASVGKLGSGLGAVHGILAGVVAGGLGLMIKKTMTSIDATAKLARQTGASTEFLSEMGFAAEQTGASQADLGSTMLRLSRRVGLYGKGAGAAAAGLKQLGFSQTELLGLNADEQFEAVINRIAELPTTAQRGAAAFEILGDSGQKFLGLIEEGPEGIARLREEAVRLGVSISAVDASKVEQANDAMNRVKTAVGGVITRITIALAPAIESIADSVTTYVLPAFENFDDKIAAVGFAFANFGLSAKIALLDIVSTGLKAFPELEKPIAQLAAFFIGAFAGMKTFFGLYVENLLAGFKEIKNVALAVVAGISAAFQSIKSGDIAGAAGAFGDAFITTFANQEDVKDPKIFQETRKSFATAQQKALDNFKSSGGLTSFVDSEKARLNKELGQNADEFATARARKKEQERKREQQTPAESESQKKSEPARFAKALQFGTSEAFDAITRAITGGKESDAKKTAVASQKLVDQSEEQRTLLDDIKNNTKPSKDKPIIVGGFA